MTKFSRVSIITVFAILTCYMLFQTEFGAKTQRSSQIHSEIIIVEQGYGYHILIGEKLLVKQEFIPGVNGKVAFQTPDDAKKVADLVKNKLINRINPEVSLEEISNLNIITLKH